MAFAKAAKLLVFLAPLNNRLFQLGRELSDVVSQGHEATKTKPEMEDNPTQEQA